MFHHNPSATGGSWKDRADGTGRGSVRTTNPVLDTLQNLRSEVHRMSNDHAAADLDEGAFDRF